jgi:chromosome segregation ATPase
MEEDTLALTSFGTSLSINTTLRNSIQSEISTLDAASLALSKAIASETSIQRSIRKDMERAKREMMEISREGGEVVENEVVHSNVARGWKEEVSGMRSILNEFVVSSEEENQGEQGMKLIPKMKMEIQTKKREHAALRRELEGYKSTVANLEDETSRIQAESGRLNAQNSKLQGEVEKKRMELEGEMRRNGRVKEAIGRSRGNSGGFARAIADKVSLIVPG